MHGVELAVEVLREHGVEASTEGGWLYIDLPDGSELFIGCEYGASLDVDHRQK